MWVLRRWKAYKLIIISSISLLSLYLCFDKVRKIWRTQLIQVHISGPIDNAIRIEIEHIVRKAFFNYEKADEFYAYLKTSFPNIKTISYRYNGSLTIDVIIESALPLIVLISKKTTEKYVCTQDKYILSDWYFSAQKLSELPSLFLDVSDENKELKKQQLVDTICAFNPELFEHYSIIWRSEFEIVLISKNSHYPIELNTVEIVSDRKSIFLEDKILYVKNIYKKNKKYHKSGMKADIRFEGILVCCIK